MLLCSRFNARFFHLGIFVGQSREIAGNIPYLSYYHLGWIFFLLAGQSTSM